MNYVAQSYSYCFPRISCKYPSHDDVRCINEIISTYGAFCSLLMGISPVHIYIKTGCLQLQGIHYHQYVIDALMNPLLQTLMNYK